MKKSQDKMKYENPEIPEHINSSREHPLKEFSTLLIGALVVVILGSLLLSFGGSWLAGKIPYSAEAKVADLYDVSTHTDNQDYSELVEYLQSLADKISLAQNLPADMKIKVHYLNSETMNAFATLGANVFMYRGLLEKLPNENTLVTLLGHEIAHVKYRHPIKSLGGGIPVAIAMTMVTSSTNSQILGDTGLFSTLKFTRDMEEQSDKEAMQTLYSLYGHLNGGAELFRIFHETRQKMDSEEPSEFFSTHPLDEKRIESFSTMAKKRGWSEAGDLTPLPDFFQKALD